MNEPPTAELVRVPSFSAPVPPVEVTVPETLDTAVPVLEDMGGLMTATFWGRAAIVYAYTYDTGGGRPPKSMENSTLFTVEGFADLRIKGLASWKTVSFYRKAWQHAVDQGWTEEAVPGKTVPLPDKMFEDEKTTGQRMVQSGWNEWHTPPQYLEAARKVLGGIDLDPASSHEANETVQAEHFYDSDGLDRPWFGRMWLNPPYGGDAERFVTRLVTEYQRVAIAAGVALVNAHCTDTRWFQPLWNHTLCFTDHRIDFVPSRNRPAESITTSTHGSVFAYLGPEPDVFAENFSQFGAVVRRW